MQERMEDNHLRWRKDRSSLQEIESLVVGTPISMGPLMDTRKEIKPNSAGTTRSRNGLFQNQAEHEERRRALLLSDRFRSSMKSEIKHHSRALAGVRVVYGDYEEVNGSFILRGGAGAKRERFTRAIPWKRSNKHTAGRRTFSMPASNRDKAPPAGK